MSRSKQMLSKFSSRARKKTLVITGSSVSFLVPGDIVEIMLGIIEKYLKVSAVTGHS